MRYDKEVKKILNEIYGPYPGVRVPTTPEEMESHDQAMNMMGKYGYRLAMVLDPTGVLTIPDLIYNINELNKNPKDPLNYFMVILTLICVIPILKYTGVTIKGLIISGKTAQALPMIQNSVAIILGAIIESSGFIMEILNELDENQKKTMESALNYGKEGLNEEELKRITEILQKMNK